MSDAPERGGEGFLKRWSRRKLAEPAALEEAERTPAAPPATPPPTQMPDGEPAPAAIDPADLPDIESLDAESDYTVFMQDGVPDDLRRLALSRLWRSDPIFANLDGLNDYDLDYSKLGIVDEVVNTIYKAGRGFRDDSEAVEAAETAETAPEPEEEESEGEGEGEAAPPASDTPAIEETAAATGPEAEAKVEPKKVEPKKDGEPAA